MTILVVDDNESNLYQLQVLLSGNGYQVVTAANGAEALAKARQNPPDLIVSDILMPVMDGFALCREWKKDERLRQIPFVFYTATYTDERDLEFALGLGAERFVVKPEEPDAFMAIIRETIQQAACSPAARAKPAADAPARLPIEAPEEEESVYLKQYNQALIRKLETKMEQLEQANRELEQYITERKRAEEQLRQSEEQFRLIAENVADLIAVLDLSGKRVYNSPSYKEILGDVEATRGTVSFNEIHPDDRDKIKRIFEETVRTGVGQRGEFRFLLRDGSVRFIESQGSVIRDREGKVVKVIVVSRDVTERKRLEQQLLQSQKMEAVGRLAGGVAHDFNNLLTVINGYSSLLLEGLDPQSVYRGHIVQIQKAGERAASLTRQLLAFSRRQVLAPQVIDLNAVIPDIEKMLRRLIGEDIDLVTKLSPNLGEIKADPGQIEQVLTNLAVNARDAMPQGGKLTIETANMDLGEEHARTHREVSPGRYVMLAVSDTGHGMDAETQSHIFEPFFTTKEAGKGTGLGLSTVHGIVEQSGGSVWVSSEPGHGTVFKIYLPRVDEARETKEQERQHEAAAAGGNETILVTEDQDSVRQLVCEVLKSKGYETLEASRGEDALRIGQLHEGPIHLLVTDVVMPGMGGRELARNLVSQHAEMRVIYMSGYTGNAIAQHQVLEEGLNIIMKPFTPEALAHKVREVLEKP